MQRRPVEEPSLAWRSSFERWGRTRALAAAAMLAVTASCSFDIDDAGTSFSCSDGETCPAGFVCVNRQCARPEEGREPVDACGELDDLADSFTGNTPGTVWAAAFAQGDAIYEVRGGRAAVEIPAGDDGAAGLATDCRYDLTGKEVYLDVQTSEDPGSFEVFLTLRYQGNDEVSLMYDGGRLVGVTRAGTSLATSASSFDPDAHRWWSVGEWDGSVVFAASSDGEAWKVLFQHDAPTWIDDVTVSFGARASEPLGGVGRAEFDDVNGG